MEQNDFTTPEKINHQNIYKNLFDDTIEDDKNEYNKLKNKIIQIQDDFDKLDEDNYATKQNSLINKFNSYEENTNDYNKLKNENIRLKNHLKKQVENNYCSKEHSLLNEFNFLKDNNQNDYTAIYDENTQLKNHL